MNLLFVCTHNRCRSILAEAITNQLARNRITAQSAGSSPADEVHPLSLSFLQTRGFENEGLSSQSWHDFEPFEADAIITMCDKAAAETCPVWFGNSVRVHWGLTDPSKGSVNKQKQAAQFNRTIDIIENRVQKLLDTNMDLLSGDHLRLGLQGLALTIY
jgi:arsenate reductase